MYIEQEELLNRLLSRKQRLLLMEKCQQKQTVPPIGLKLSQFMEEGSS
jgi:hypothetical protein